MGNKFLEQEGDVSTLGVRLDSPRLCCCDDRRVDRSVKLPCIDEELFSHKFHTLYSNMLCLFHTIL